jgi:hypothetical protein
MAWDSLRVEGGMAAGIDAVIAALRVVLEEAQKSNAPQAKANAANCWINRLPGAWTGRWRKLVVPANSSGEIPRGEFIGHVRAVLAYLETSRETRRPRKWWLTRQRNAAPQMATPPQVQHQVRPVNLLRVRKPMPGVH